MTNDPVFTELLARAVQRSKAEIENLVHTFVVPSDIESFAELHDFTDANCLGGFCDKEFRMELNTKLANGQDFVGSVPFEDAELCDMAQHLADCCQYEIDDWIKAGGPAAIGVLERNRPEFDDVAHVVRDRKAWQTLAMELHDELLTHNDFEGHAFELVQRAAKMIKERAC